jgi:RING finger protein 113A
MRKRSTIENEDGSNNEESLMYVQKKNMKADNNLFFSTASSKTSAYAKPNEESKKPSFHFESSKDFSRDARAIRERALKQAT